MAGDFFAGSQFSLPLVILKFKNAGVERPERMFGLSLHKTSIRLMPTWNLGYVLQVDDL